MSNFSEEEKKAIDRLKYALIYDRESISSLMGFNDIKIVLQLVNKQQKEIESNKQMIDELNFRYNIEHSKNLSKKELINEQQEEIEELRKENFDTVYIQAIENYKAKIREKIKEIENEHIGSTRNALSVLQELLEE